VNAPVFAIASAAPAVTALLGSAPVRFFLFGEAPQGVERPYAVWQTVYGSPENKLADTPDDDRWGVQVDVYADDAATARAAAEAIRNAVEPVAYVVSWNGEFREPETKLYRYSFTTEFLTPRS
jgi:hypothetical protein